MKKKRFVALIKTTMKITIGQAIIALIFTCYTFASNVSAQEILDKKITLSLDDTELDVILKFIQKQADVKFVYSPTAIKGQRKASLHVSEKRLGEILDEVLKPLEIEYKISKDRILLYMQKREAESFNLNNNELVPLEMFTLIKGRVTNDENEGLPGVSVVVKGTTTGTTTDAEGNYSLDVPEGSNTLVFSFIGYSSEEVTIDNRSTIDVSLLPDIKALTEVVVVGYGTQKRSDVVGSLTSVSEKDFREQPVTRLDQALQGRAAGVTITNAGGAPGGDVRIRIRGANSLSGNNEPLYVLDGFVGADFTTINPQDIASIEVLKDASATAIYGSRGANGVVIITTKSGKKGDMQVDFGARYYSSKVLKKQNTLNAADFAVVANERAAAFGTSPVFTDAEIQNYRQNGGTDWQDEIFRTAPGLEFQLGISGGNDKTNYLISGNYLSQDGIIKNSDFTRYSIRSNISSQVSKKFAVRFNFAGTRKENLNTSGVGQRSSALGQALSWAPTTPVYDQNGDYILKDPTSSIFGNPVAKVFENEYRALNTNMNILTGLRYEIISGLNLDVQLGLNYLNAQSQAFEGYASNLLYPTAGRSSNENITWQNTNTLNYKKILNDVHSIDITAVFESQKFEGAGFNANSSDLKYPDQSYNNLSLSGSSTVGSAYSSWSLLSQMGRINYGFKDRYLISAAIRRDGSSKFRGKNKYSVFPSVALGWKISEEEFLKSLDVISSLKLRGSWGLTGNQGIDAYQTYSQYVSNLDDAGVVFDGNSESIVPGILMGNPGNLDLKWETTEQVDVGADLELLRGRISFSVDYFVKNTRDVLMYRSLPAFVGGYQIQSNIGELENKGWEFSLGATPLDLKGFQWTTSFNVSLLENKMKSLNGERDTIIFNNSPHVLIAGQSMNSFWGLKYLGTWKPNQADEAALYKLNPGDARYEDLNNDAKYDSKDYQIIGNGIPTTSIGWNNTFTYKNLSLNIFLQGLFGFDKLNYTYANGMLASTDAKQVIFDDIKNRYIPGINETSDIPAFSPAGSNAIIRTSRFIEKGDFIRLKNISLSYSLPKSILANTVGIRVFVSATNLLTFTEYKGIDPESNSSAASGLTWDNYNTDVQQGVDFASYPNSKTYTAGINFTF